MSTEFEQYPQQTSQSYTDQNWKQARDRKCRNNGGGDKRWLGVLIVAIGLVMLLKRLDVLYFSWHITWPLVLVAVGLFIGIRKQFRNNAWWIITLIGVVNLIPIWEIRDGVYSSEIAAPAIVIIAGIALFFRSRKKKSYMDNMTSNTTADSFIKVDTTFGGRKEIITSKDFKGGKISATFAGAEINLMQTDSPIQPMVMYFNVSFAGVELIVPSHWEVQNNINPSFGSVEDHRAPRVGSSPTEDKKILVLNGHCSFGSIELKSY